MAYICYVSDDDDDDEDDDDEDDDDVSWCSLTPSKFGTHYLLKPNECTFN